MKVTLFYCILLLTVSIVESIRVKVLLRGSWRHANGRMKKLPITNKMCSATTCKKCRSVSKYTNRKDKKLRKYCSKILNVAKCCHAKLVVRSGDFM